MENREGPETINIPASTVISCAGCRYHEHKMVRSGRNPIYKTDCVHEAAPVLGSFMVGNLPGYDDHRTPEWCPYLKKDETKIDILTWLEELGFTKTERSWSKPYENGMMFYAYNKGKITVEVCHNWNKKYDFYPEQRVSFFNYSDAYYSTWAAGDVFQGYMGGKNLGTFDNMSKSLFIELINHYEK